MDLKNNINKIHYELSEQFESVNISEKSNREYGNYIEIVVESSGKQLFAIIEKSNLENNNFEWLYKSNPILENSYLVERNSTVGDFCKNVVDIFEKKRFDYDYLREVNKNKD